MVRFITFRDWDVFYKWPFSTVAWKSHNKIGYLTDDDIVIYPFMRGLRRVTLDRIRRPYTLSTMPPDFSLAEQVKAFFTQNVPNRQLFYHGLNALNNYVLKNNSYYDDYLDSPIKLPILEPISNEEHEARWQRFMEKIRAGDIIQSINTESFVSRLIARFDHGTWSHTAGYIGRGLVVEALPGGVVARHIEVYNSPKYRMGIYRPGHDEESLLRFITLQLSTVGDRYSYWGVVKVSIRILLGRKPKMPQLTPNEMVLMTNLPLIYVV